MKAHYYIILFSILLLSLCIGCRQQPVAADIRPVPFKNYSDCHDIDSLKAQLEQAEKAKDIKAQIFIGNRIGVLYRNSSSFQESLDIHFHVLKLAEQMKDTSAICVTLNDIGTDLRRIGSLADASDYLYQCVQYCDAFSNQDDPQNSRIRLAAMNGIGNIFLTLEYYNEAGNIFRNILRLQPADQHLGLAINYANLGSIYEEKDELDSAYYYYRKSYEQNRIINSSLGLGLCHIYFGKIHEKRDNLEQALAEYKQAAELLEPTHDRWHWLEACIPLGRVYLEMGEWDKARHYICKATEVATEINALEHLCTCHDLYYKYYLQRHEVDLALKSKELSLRYTDSLLHNQKKQAIFQIQRSYETARHQNEIKSLNAQNDRLENEMLRWQLMVFILLSAFMLVWGVSQHLTARRLRILRRKAKESEKLKDKFINLMCHEIRTPLNSINGFTSLLLDDSIPQEEKEAMPKIITDNTNYLTSILDDLLEVSHLDSQSGVMSFKYEDVVTLTREQIALNEARRSERVEFEFVTNEDFLLIRTSRKYFMYLIGCLLENAYKFTAEGKVTLILKHHTEKKQLEIIVRDTGIGIDEKEAEHIFERFYKIDTFAQGIGIGLYFARMITDRFDGTIRLNTGYKEGAEFVVVLPVK